VREGGPDAFAGALAEARPLAELLWMRETAGGVFDTPERRAELEKRLRELSGRIRDENVRFHYVQEMRERAQGFFGLQSGNSRMQGQWGQSQGVQGWAGQQGRPGTGRGLGRGRAAQAAGRMAVSDSLARSAMV